MIDLFNKSRLKQLEFALESQAQELKEKESYIKILETKLAYQEGELKSKYELIESLKSQLTREIEEREKIQKAFLFQPANQFKEEINGMFLEDEEILKQMKKEFSGLEEGEL